MIIKCMKVVSFAILLLGSIQEKHAASMTYSEAWGEEEFRGSNLRNITNIVPEEDCQLYNNPEMATAFAHSPALNKLFFLDLSNQDIDDTFIEMICQNPTFSWIKNIDLRGNPRITVQSLEFIAESDVIGSIRDLPQMSGRYGRPSSEVYIETKGTGITEEDLIEFRREPQRFDFSIRYLNPRTYFPTKNPVRNAIKWLQVQ